VVLPHLTLRLPFLRNERVASAQPLCHTGTISAGLVAGVSWHPIQTEGATTGGDLGITLAQPHVQIANSKLLIDPLKTQSGLLTQAKAKKCGEAWGELTDSQKKLLPGRESFLSLLGYEYSDLENIVLEPFAWTPCTGYSIKQVEEWLSSNKFPKKVATSEIVKALGAGTLGTTDPGIIEKVICPPNAPYLTISISIDWKGGRPPPAQIRTAPRVDQDERLTNRQG
jgi:hypothetical protein